MKNSISIKDGFKTIKGALRKEKAVLFGEVSLWIDGKKVYQERKNQIYPNLLEDLVSYMVFSNQFHLRDGELFSAGNQAVGGGQTGRDGICYRLPDGEDELNFRTMVTERITAHHDFGVRWRGTVTMPDFPEESPSPSPSPEPGPEFHEIIGIALGRNFSILGLDGSISASQQTPFEHPYARKGVGVGGAFDGPDNLNFPYELDPDTPITVEWEIFFDFVESPSP